MCLHKINAAIYYRNLITQERTAKKNGLTCRDGLKVVPAKHEHTIVINRIPKVSKLNEQRPLSFVNYGRKLLFV